MKRDTVEYDEDGNPMRNAKGDGKTLSQYGGEARIQVPSFSLGLMGAGGKLASGDFSFFIYGALSSTSGVGIGPPAIFAVTGLALGGGMNRAVVVPPIQEVASFPLVQIVMGRRWRQHGRQTLGQGQQAIHQDAA